MAFFLFVSNIYSQFDSNHPDLRLYGFNCTSNNITIENVYLSATVDGIPLQDFVQTCDPNSDSYNVTIWMNYTQNQAGSINETRLFSTLIIGGVPQEINKYLGTLDSTKKEIDFIGDKDVDPTNFYVMWTRKEALLKASGEGVSDNLHLIECLEEHLEREKEVFKMRSFIISENYVASIATTLDQKELLFWNWG